MAPVTTTVAPTTTVATTTVAPTTTVATTTVPVTTTTTVPIPTQGAMSDQSSGSHTITPSLIAIFSVIIFAFVA
jgi:hypothetical protein